METLLDVKEGLSKICKGKNSHYVTQWDLMLCVPYKTMLRGPNGARHQIGEQTLQCLRQRAGRAQQG